MQSSVWISADVLCISVKTASGLVSEAGGIGGSAAVYGLHRTAHGHTVWDVGLQMVLADPEVGAQCFQMWPFCNTGTVTLWREQAAFGGVAPGRSVLTHTSVTLLCRCRDNGYFWHFTCRDFRSSCLIPFILSLLLRKALDLAPLLCISVKSNTSTVTQKALISLTSLTKILFALRNRRQLGKEKGCGK